MGELVTFTPPPRPSRAQQHGIFRLSLCMFLMLRDIEGMEDHGGAPMAGLNTATRHALQRRGLIAVYHARPGDPRYCVSPMGRIAMRCWRVRP